MLDISLIRAKRDWVEGEIAKLNTEAPIGQIVALDSLRRELLTEAEELKHRRNVVSKEIGRMKRSDARQNGIAAFLVVSNGTQQMKEAEVRQAKITEMRAVSDQIQALDQRLRQVNEELREATLWVPNLPHHSVPVGPDEGHNVILRQEGEPREAGFELLPHWDLGPKLGIIDFERGVKLSGTRFYLLRGMGSRLQRALIQWMLDVAVDQHGYTEMHLPLMVRGEMMVGAAQLPKFADNIYHDAEEDFWWLGTAEVALTNIHRDEILPPDSLPIKYVAYTPCFRREKMSAGRDVRGIKRGHQFDKVEMYRFARPETSYDALEEMVEQAASLCQALEIPYRVVEMCTGDLGFQAAKKYDLEMWAPGCQEWLEVSSLSNCESFQSRRANIRFRREEGGKPEFVHTLNGSALALPRVMIAIIETYQQADGSIAVPDVLQPYVGASSISA
jgi:seryl-tRNA synthetase